MIARIWRGATAPANADAYAAHLRDNILPELASLPGNAGLMVLRRPDGDAVAFTVITLWRSLDAIRGFAGDDVEAAVVPAEARALLSAHDDRAEHWAMPLVRLIVTLDNVGSADAK